MACAQPVAISPFDLGLSGRSQEGKMTQVMGYSMLFRMYLKAGRGLVRIFREDA